MSLKTIKRVNFEYSQRVRVFWNYFIGKFQEEVTNPKKLIWAWTVWKTEDDCEISQWLKTMIHVARQKHFLSHIWLKGSSIPGRRRRVNIRITWLVICDLYIPTTIYNMHVSYSSYNIYEYFMCIYCTLYLLSYIVLFIIIFSAIYRFIHF